ncbi:MAG TPA: NAD(P)H-dependent oxidoreductase [Gemmatimonadaceae bacterium]|nr:NAD(P)H-dependent oxidoreductase [Gemmatimonadaceae bacterium]
MSKERCAVNFLVFAGSSRKDSYNGRLATLAGRAAANVGAAVDNACFTDFPVPWYDQDVETEAGIPVGAQRFAERLNAADGLILSSPEYNASMPGAVKNLIDWVSRIRPQPFNGKQALLLSASPSMAGGNRGLWSLRIPLEHLGMRVYPDMFSLAQAHKAFSGEGLADSTLQSRFDSTIAGFIDLVEAAKHYGTIRKQWIEFLGEHPHGPMDRVETSPADAA